MKRISLKFRLAGHINESVLPELAFLERLSYLWYKDIFHGISNDVKFTTWLVPIVKSRLGEESLAFAPYNAPQIEEILYERSKIAFKENVVEPLVVSYCSSKAAQEHGDVRKALDLLRISAELADKYDEYSQCSKKPPDCLGGESSGTKTWIESLDIISIKSENIIVFSC